jgi:hypothetical protein
MKVSKLQKINEQKTKYMIAARGAKRGKWRKTL